MRFRILPIVLVLLAATACADEIQIEVSASQVSMSEYNGHDVWLATIPLPALESERVLRGTLQARICSSEEDVFLECEVAHFVSGQARIPQGKTHFISKAFFPEADCHDIRFDISGIIDSCARSGQPPLQLMMGRLSSENVDPFSLEALDSGALLNIIIEIE